ncbi:DUF6928 family protein [Streptomyces sp. O3]
MGSKAAVVIFTDVDPRGVFQGGAGADRVKSRFLAEKAVKASVQELAPLPLDLAVWPGAGIVCAAHFSDFQVICSRELAREHPSALTEWISRMADGRNAYGVFMHSAEDWAALGVWSSEGLVRALSVKPGVGVIEDVGERLPFEIPFWGGDRPVCHDVNYALPFHPIDLGNEALREFFGFILEGREDEFCVDPEEIEVPAFRGSCLNGVPIA